MGISKITRLLCGKEKRNDKDKGYSIIRYIAET